jgi:hypothetical protein
MYPHERPKRSVTSLELAANPDLNRDFWRAVTAKVHPAVTIEGPIRRARWDEPFDYFASDYGWNK